MGMDSGARAGTGVEWPAPLDPMNWFAPGTVSLQQPAFTVGAHFPLRQHSIASRVRAPAKQSKGRVNSAIAERLTKIRK